MLVSQFSFVDLRALRGSTLFGLTFHHKNVKVRGLRYCAQLPHHQRDLPTVISRVIRDMLHQIDQLHLCSPNRNQLLQAFIGDQLDKLKLFSLNLDPLLPNSRQIRIHIRIE